MTLFEEIVRNLNEELGISNLVSQVTNDIITEIVKNSKANNTKTGIIENYTIFGKTLTIKYQIVYFKTIEELEYSDIANPGFLDKSLKFLTTTICYIKKDNKYIDFNGTTQHEIEHLYQIVKAKKHPLSKPTSAVIYNKACDLAKHARNIYEGIVGYSIYYNAKFEKDAFANELYRIIMDNPTVNPQKIIENTTLYQNIKIIKKYTEQYTSIDEYVIEKIVNQNFGKHFNWWLKIANSVISNYYTKIGKIMIKAEKDLNNNQSFININKKLEEPPQLIKDI